MADVLSQSQIDALLKSMQGSGPEEEVQAVEQKKEAEETKKSPCFFMNGFPDETNLYSGTFHPGRGRLLPQSLLPGL